MQETKVDDTILETPYINNSTSPNPKNNNSIKKLDNSGNFITTLLSILLLLAVLIAGFFAWQTQRLVQELNKLRFVTPTPAATIEPTIDPTENWKVWENSKAGITFKYPEDWEISTAEANNMVITLTKVENDKKYSISVSLPPNKKIASEDFQEVIIGGVKGQRFQKEIGRNQQDEIVQVDKDGDAFLFTYTSEKEVKNNFIEVFDNLLTTVKFQSSNNVACTMDAKICADGSAVGRVAPSCEFAPCPTPKE